MESITSIEKMKLWSTQVREAGNTLGLVPTMGCLHEGHLSLVRRAVETCDRTVASIFVNPKQFGPGEDLETYPRDLERDQRLLEEAGVDVMFRPDLEAMYPEDFQTYVNVEGVTDHLCGKKRPGFFRGVATVVLKLFNIVRPHNAFFGEKDWQQLAVIETMVRDLDLDVAIVRMPIVRDPDGLATSSRNLYLSAEEKQAALSLSRALRAAKHQVNRGESSAQKLREEIRRIIEGEKQAVVDYISVCDPENFVEKQEVEGKSLIALAVRVGKARLIDNCIVERI